VVLHECTTVKVEWRVEAKGFVNTWFPRLSHVDGERFRCGRCSHLWGLCRWLLSAPLSHVAYEILLERAEGGSCLLGRMVEAAT
jgi:hypothetical protein